MSDLILTVSDDEEKSNLNNYHVINWNSYFTSRKNNIFSIPAYIDIHKEVIKSKYLEFIFNLGETDINGTSIVSKLEIRPNLSYWWLTLIAEKCNAIKSPQIDNAIKLIAFKDWLNNSEYTKIIFKTSNIELASAANLLSDSLGIDFEWRKLKTKSNTLGLVKYFYLKLPLIIQSLISLFKRLILRWNLKGVGVKKWKESKASITFFSFLFNLPSESIRDKNFESNYWTGLPNLLIENNISSNWLHLYNPDRSLTSAKFARNIIGHFNNNLNKIETHVTLDSFWSAKVFKKIIVDWIFLLKANLKIRKHIIFKCDFLWPLFKSDFNGSMVGPQSINNLITLNLFEKALSCLPRQKKGFYLQENQGWEYSLISAWRNSKHGGSLVAIPHSTIRYWDLRYFFDIRSYNTEQRNCSLPLPDFVGINGDGSKRMLVLSGYPKDKLLEVEALRYQYLDGVKISKNVNNLKILVLGGKGIDSQMKLLDSADNLIDKSLKFTIKSDPWNPIKLNDLQKMRMELTAESMDELLSKYNVVYTDNITSAAVDAYCTGKKIISMLDSHTLNLSPLLDKKDVLFVSSPEQLADNLNNFSWVNEDKRDYFYLDPKLSKWLKLLKSEV
jgi:surface carbohydrate biosynthesis protein (TIGR04326 family)